MRSSVWTSRVFENIDQKITRLSCAKTVNPFNIELPTVEGNDANTPYTAYYYSFACRKKWLFRASQCQSESAFYAMYEDLEKEIKHLSQLQKSMLEMMRGWAAPIDTAEYNYFNKQLILFIGLTRTLLTAIELDYYFYLSEEKISKNKRLLTKNYIKEMDLALGYLDYAMHEKVDDLMKIDKAQTIKLRLIVFSIFSSVRNTKTFPTIEDQCLIEGSSHLIVLCNNYYDCHIDNPETFNVHYFKQIVGEELQALYDTYNNHENINLPSPAKFQLFFGFSQSHRNIGHVYLMLHDYQGGIDYLLKAINYLLTIIEQIFEHPEIPYIYSFGNDLDNSKLQFIPPGQPQINELCSRVDSILDFTNKIESTFSIINEKEIMDPALLKNYRELYDRILTVYAFLDKDKIKEEIMAFQSPQKENKEKVEVEEKESESVEFSEPNVSIPVKKQKPKKIKSDVITREEPRAPLPCHLPPLTYTPPAIVKETLTKEPTIRISEDEIKENEKVKQRHYKEEEKHKADLLAKQETPILDDSDGFIFEFESVVSRKNIKARLDDQACINVMGAREFYQMRPELMDILKKGRPAGKHGTGIRFVSRSEINNKGLQPGYWFKIKPSHPNLRIYGRVIPEENGENRITFNMPAVGKLHDTVAHLPKLKGFA